MHQKKRLKLTVAAGILVPAIALFQPHQTVANAADSQTVNIQFEGLVGNKPFACGETYRLGTAETAVTPLDFRFYVSEVALIDTAGQAVPLVLTQDGQWQHQNVALLDFEDKTGGCTNGTDETRTQVVGAVPEGEYSGLQFTVGVPFGLNHLDSTLAPSPLNLTSMWWNWNFGYKFARLDFEAVAETANTAEPGEHNAQTISESVAKSELEAPDGHTDNAQAEGGHTGDVHAEDGHAEGGHAEGGHAESGHSSVSQAFAMHLGSVGCQIDSAQAPVNCSFPNRPEVVLLDFNPTQDVVVVDLAALLADTNLSENQEGTAVGCMSNPEDSDCSGIMQNLGLPFQNQPVVEQTVFSLKSAED